MTKGWWTRPSRLTSRLPVARRPPPRTPGETTPPVRGEPSPVPRVAAAVARAPRVAAAKLLPSPRGLRLAAKMRKTRPGLPGRCLAARTGRRTCDGATLPHGRPARCRAVMIGAGRGAPAAVEVPGGACAAPVLRVGAVRGVAAAPLRRRRCWRCADDGGACAPGAGARHRCRTTKRFACWPSRRSLPPDASSAVSRPAARSPSATTGRRSWATAAPTASRTRSPRRRCPASCTPPS